MDGRSQAEREMIAARNQSLFREVNARIRATVEAFGTPTRELVIMCECASTECVATIHLATAAYERLRANPRRFAVRPGHVYEDVERVVEEAETFVVVEKFGAAIPVVEALAPASA